MQRKARGVIEDGSLYDVFFQPATGENQVIKKGDAKLEDTIQLLKDFVPMYKDQARMVAAALRDIRGDVEQTCHNIWYFLMHYLAYDPDTPNKEQVRSTSRLWADKIGDCDCFAFTISCILSNLNISHSFRITAYPNSVGFSHVYIVVPHLGKEIIVDACLEVFNTEIPYIDNIDVEMDFDYLNGFDEPILVRNYGSVDARDLMRYDFTDDLSGLFKKKSDSDKRVFNNVKKNVHATIEKEKPDINGNLHILNRTNPVSVTFRLGILAAMRMNVYGIAEMLRYTYETPEQAEKRGLNKKRFSRYVRVRNLLEKKFFDAGGKPNNLREAILTGRGNADKAIALDGYELYGIDFDTNQHLVEILGQHLLMEELPDEQNDVNGLGIVTEAAIATATGMLSIVGGILKNIGVLQEKGEPGNDPRLDEIEKQEAETKKQASSLENDANQRTSENQAPPETPPAQSPPNPPPPEKGTTSKSEDPWYKKFSDVIKENKMVFIIGGATLVAVGVIWLIKKVNDNQVEKVPSLGRIPNNKARREANAKQAKQEIARELTLRSLAL